MVFGFFSRAKAESVAAQKAEGLLEESSTHLNTPSPTLSAADAPPQSPELASLDARPKKRTRSMSPDKSHPLILSIESHVTNEPQHPLNLEELLTLLKRVPAPVVHSYLLTRLPRVTESEASTLSNFFSELRPPPQLHCVRCHKEYTEVENTDRSCLIPHDDESAIVEHVGSTKRHTYETLWGCCNRTVEVKENYNFSSCFHSGY